MSGSQDRLWRNYLLGESLSEKDIFSYIQALEEFIQYSKPRTMTEKRRLAVAKQNLREVKRYARRLQNENQILHEKLNILEESIGEDE